MVPFVLPNVLLIAEECTKEEYIKLILPELGPDLLPSYWLLPLGPAPGGG